MTYVYFFNLFNFQQCFDSICAVCALGSPCNCTCDSTDGYTIFEPFPSLRGPATETTAVDFLRAFASPFHTANSQGQRNKKPRPNSVRPLLGRGAPTEAQSPVSPRSPLSTFPFCISADGIGQPAPAAGARAAARSKGGGRRQGRGQAAAVPEPCSHPGTAPLMGGERDANRARQNLLSLRLCAAGVGRLPARRSVLGAAASPQPGCGAAAAQSGDEGRTALPPALPGLLRFSGWFQSSERFVLPAKFPTGAD